MSNQHAKGKPLGEPGAHKPASGHASEPARKKRKWSRVDEMPLAMRALVELYAVVVIVPWLLQMTLLRLLIRTRIRGRENLNFDSPRIYCLWHQAAMLMPLVLFPHIPTRLQSGPMAWISHPAWWARPMNMGLQIIGVRRHVFGSSGNKGREAAEKLAETIGKGYSAAIAPDGPRGPAKVARKGALHIALQTGVPVVPLRFSTNWGFRLPGWDRKWFPLPLARVEMHIGKPIWVSDENLEAALKNLTDALGP